MYNQMEEFIVSWKRKGPCDRAVFMVPFRHDLYLRGLGLWRLWWLWTKWVEQYRPLEMYLQWKKKNGSPSVMLWISPNERYWWSGTFPDCTSQLALILSTNYLALKRLGQAGDSFNDVISNLLRIQRNHQQEKEKKWQEQQQQKSGYDDDNSINKVINDLYPSSFFDEALEHHRQQTDELFWTIEEAQQREQWQEHLSNKLARKQ